ncbi:MAG: hypothetical protein MJ207_01585 [Bacilli bacterium]|nr:hypothetical protein [Bacilli bacterium]
MGTYEIAFLVSVPSLAFLIGIAWFCTIYFHHRFYRSIMWAGNSVRSFVIDVKHEQVRYFDRNKIRKLRTMTLNEFLSQFSKPDRNKLSAWISSAFRKKNFEETYLPTRVKIDRTNHFVFTILKMVEIKKSEEILHIDSYLFRYLNRQNKAGYFMGESALPEINQFLKFIRFRRGAVINFTFSLVSKNNIRNPLDYLLAQQLKEITLVCANSPQRYLYANKDSEFALVDLKSKSNNTSDKLVNRILKAINRFLELNSLSDRVLIHVGVVHVNEYPQKADQLIAMAQEMSEMAINKNVLTVTYSKELVEAKATTQHLSEIEQILKNKQISYGFQSIYDVRKERVLGFLSSSWVKNSKTKMIDVYNRSTSEEEQKKLVNIMTHDVVARYGSISADNNKILFMNSKFMDTISFMRSLRDKFAFKIAPCFDEYDIDYYLKHEQDFFEIIRALKFRGFFPCLKLTDRSIVLDQKVYAQFEYFIVNLKIDREDNKKRGNSPALIGYRAIVEKLLRYEKPIIVSQADSWSLAEIVIRSGISYLAGEAVAPVSQTLVVPTTKNMLKMRKMLE